MFGHGDRVSISCYPSPYANIQPIPKNSLMFQYNKSSVCVDVPVPSGFDEEEKEGVLVVSKVFYQSQPRQCGLGAKNAVQTTVEGCAKEVSNVVVVFPCLIESCYFPVCRQ